MHYVANELDEKIHQTRSIINGVLADQNNLIGSTKFGPDSLVFLHLITSIAPDMPIVWVDTGYNNRNTLAFVDEAKCHLALNLHRFEPVDHTIQIPPALGDPAHEAFKDMVKLDPFRKALIALNATHWISSVRAYQTPNRKTLPIIMPMPGQLTKVHPMLAWSAADVLDYRKLHQLPVGPDAYDPTKGDALGECGLHEVQTFFN